MREYQAQHDLVSRFAGVSSLNPIPLTEHLEIHEAGRQVISEEIMSNGDHGFWWAGTSSEGPVLF